MSSEDLATFFEAADLSQFLTAFSDAGYKKVDSVKSLSPGALEKLGVMNGDLKKFEKALKDYETAKSAEILAAQQRNAQISKEALAAAAAGKVLTAEQVYSRNLQIFVDCFACLQHSRGRKHQMNLQCAFLCTQATVVKEKYRSTLASSNPNGRAAGMSDVLFKVHKFSIKPSYRIDPITR